MTAESVIWVKRVDAEGPSGTSAHIVKDSSRTMCGLHWGPTLWKSVELEPTEKSCETCLRVVAMRER